MQVLIRIGDMTYHVSFRPYDGSEDFEKSFSSEEERDKYIEDNNHNGCCQVYEIWNE